MHWVYLLLAIGLEVAGTTCMKLAEGFSKLLPSILVFVFYGGTLVMLTLAFEKLPVSVAYTVWGSVGTVLIVVIGTTWFDESLSTIQYVSIGLVIAGVIGINAGRIDIESGAPKMAEPAAAATQDL